MTKGRVLYSEIFTNHQMIATYISFAIQEAFHPETLYQLVLYHRFFIIGFSLLMSVLIVLRFKMTGAGFVLLYEATKFYLFGNLFLPEALVVYPLVYLFGISWQKLHKKPISQLDLILSAVFTWFVVFTREPFIPVALVLLIIIIWGQRKSFLSLIILTILSLLVLASVWRSVGDYIFQVFIFNLRVTVPNEVTTSAVALKGFFYPITLLFEGKWNFIRTIFVLLDLLFILLISVYTVKEKKIALGVFVICILGLASFRFVEPGTLFFEAFHLLPWYGLFLMSICLLIEWLATNANTKNMGKLGLLSSIVIFGYTISGQSFFWEKVETDAIFTVNYAHYYINGEVIKTLAKPTDTLFTDMWDYFIHWQADLDSSYQYALYTFVMRGYPLFDEARLRMFIDNPPDFYYTYCPRQPYTGYLPEEIVPAYVQLHRDGKPTCTYVKKSKLAEITKEQWEKAKGLGFLQP